MAEDAGMDLYEALGERQVTWDGLEAAAVDEYRLLGRPIEGQKSLAGAMGRYSFLQRSGTLLWKQGRTCDQGVVGATPPDTRAN
jgi:hypothetical protein